MAYLIDYKNVEIRQAEQIVLHDVNLQVGNGELIYLLGKVGSGKSSLMKTIYGALPIASGSAQVLEYDMNRIRLRKLPSHDCPVAGKLYEHVINLFNDEYFTEEQAIKTCEVINGVLCKV